MSDWSWNIPYETVYGIFSDLGFPWILDTDIDAMYHVLEYDVSYDQYLDIMEAWMYGSDEWARTPPEGWLALPDRLVPRVPRDPTEQELRDYLLELVRTQLDNLQRVEAELMNASVPVHEISWAEELEASEMQEMSETLLAGKEYSES